MRGLKGSSSVSKSQRGAYALGRMKHLFIILILGGAVGIGVGLIGDIVGGQAFGDPTQGCNLRFK